MNINKNKSIRKGFIFAKTIFPAAGVLLLATQMTGCTWIDDKSRLRNNNNNTYGTSIKQSQGNSRSKNTNHRTDKTDIRNPKKIYANSIEGYFTNNKYSISVISYAQKLVIYISKLAHGGEQAVYPVTHSKAGQPIVDYKGDRIDYRGFVFYNPKDQSYQVAKGDGTGVMIINKGTQKQKEKIQKYIKRMTPDPNNLSIQHLKKLYKYMVKKLEINDIYNSDTEYVNKSLKKIDNNTVDKDGCVGLYQRCDQEQCKALLIFTSGETEFYGTATSDPQKFKDKAVIIQHGKDIRLVQANTFIEDYRTPEKEEIKLDSWRPILVDDIKKNKVQKN